MKLVTRPRLIALAAVLVLVGLGVWLDRRETPIREGRVVIDEAFLHRLQTEDAATTRDPAIRALAAATFKGDILCNMLITGAVTVDLRRLDRETVEVTVAESYNAINTTMVVMSYRRHRVTLREFISLTFSTGAFVRREYWEPGNSSHEMPPQPLPPQSIESP